MNERIKALRKFLNMTQEEFSKQIGLSRNFIAQVEIGTKVPSDRTITDICREYNVNEDWLRTGNGERERKDRKKGVRMENISSISNRIRGL
jgi:HTH-type transcriptional regulator / antitoxin PezA